ncbi:MAG: hypothetical protein IAE92_04405 [Burkholderiaceae bacterium]|nr:hypothetical protein [Burkholderiaceae bacterium]
MRAIAYFSCAILVALPVLYGLAITGLSLVKVQVRSIPFVDLLFSFGSLIPVIFVVAFPKPLVMVLAYLMVFLVLRRCWLFIAKKQRTPASFVGFQKVLGYVGFWSFLLSVLAFPIAYTVGLPISPAHLMLVPMVCVPWAFFITEIASFWQKTATAVPV